MPTTTLRSPALRPPPSRTSRIPIPMPRPRLSVAAPVVLLLALAAPAWVDAQGRAPQEPEPRPQPEQRPSEHRALSDAVRRAERATNGQVLSAERVQFDGRDVNRVKIIDGRGRVRVYWDDPRPPRSERSEPRRERNERADPATRDEPPRRTRRHDGRAFNL